MSDCSNCSGGCGGCAGVLALTEPEIQMLKNLGQIPFLPIARTVADPAPIYLEESFYPVEEYGLILQVLETKGLISLDFDRPLKNMDREKYAAYPIWGSMALTARGQQVVEMMELQGVQ